MCSHLVNGTHTLCFDNRVKRGGEKRERERERECVCGGGGRVQDGGRVSDSVRDSERSSPKFVSRRGMVIR